MIAEGRSAGTRYVLVTGAGAGLGKAFCLRLAQDGWNVACADIDVSAAQKTAKECISVGGQARPEELDVSDCNAWEQLQQRLATDWPQLDLLVNNAGITMNNPFANVTPEQFDTVYGVNIRGMFFLTQSVLPQLEESR